MKKSLIMKLILLLFNKSGNLGEKKKKNFQQMKWKDSHTHNLKVYRDARDIQFFHF